MGDQSESASDGTDPERLRLLIQHLQLAFPGKFVLVAIAVTSFLIIGAYARITFGGDLPSLAAGGVAAALATAGMLRQ